MNQRIKTLFILISLTQFHCQGLERKQGHSKPNKDVQLHKPPAFYNDSAMIQGAAIIIYQPDSFQLAQMKSIIEPGTYEAMMHEYEYQIKNAQKIIAKIKDPIPIKQLVNIRYLILTAFDQSKTILDLNKYDDPFGILLFNGKDFPILADMMNFEQALYYELKINPSGD